MSETHGRKSERSSRAFTSGCLRNKWPEQKKVFPRIHRSASHEFHTLADWLLLYTRFGLSLPEDSWEKLLPFLAIIIVWPLVLGDMLRRMLQ
jgi:hypothetical protein